jgi:hypothetical protein
MENTNRLNDQEIIDLAWEAVRSVFTQRAIETSEIEVRHTENPAADTDNPDGETKASVWLVHRSLSDMFNPADTARANQRLWRMLRERGDPRLLPLYHGFRSDPAATKKAA